MIGELRIQSADEVLIRAIERIIIASLPSLIVKLHSPDWKFHFMPSERERLLEAIRLIR